ncbi:MAG: ATP-dependent DNA helicase RecG [bacterium]|nr:ATP-dependent DNA helicase RecG [bacterium]
MNETTNKFLSTSVQYLKGIGEKRAQALQNAGVVTIGDLLQYYPRRYLDRSHIVRIGKLRPEQTATVVGRIITQGVKKGRRSRFVVLLSDDSGFLSCVWFAQVPYWQKLFKVGQTLAVSGKIGYFGGLQIVHPEFDLISDSGEDHEDEFLHTGKIIPLYPSSEALSRVGFDSRGFRRAIRNLFRNLDSPIEDSLPDAILQQQQLISLDEAFRNIHFPSDFEKLQQAKTRLKFDELFFLEFLLAYRKHNLSQQQKGIQFEKVGDRLKTLVDQLPFELTEAQKKVIREIRSDMKKSHPMYRLLQGDVGSGKTIVALVAILIALENGYQAALMAPTEILAEQHYFTFRSWLEHMEINVKLLIGGQRKVERENILASIENGECHIVIGTHALVQEHVNFHRLGLVVIDEQHRFGVAQRQILTEKGENPDVLIMTATPIPRTLSLTVYGDLDVSIIDELPEGRLPVRTSWRYENKRKEIYEFVRSKVAAGQQAYIVFPLVEESEKLDLKAATESYEMMSQDIFPDFKLALLHGRMKSDEKDNVMAAFKRGDIQILVSTTVIEVGVDVPQATIMVVEHAERFGLTQLHQLRGRVGRGSEQSYCILIARHPLTEDAITRLNTMISTNDGFKIAEVDLQLRGTGEFFGTRQHGIAEFKIADPLHDTALLEKARKIAFEIIDKPHELHQVIERIQHNSFVQNYKDKIEIMRIG